MTSTTTAFTPEYIEKCFFAWVGAGCPEDIKPHMSIFPEENGRFPHHSTVKGWRNKYHWRERADSLDERAMELVEPKIIQKKAEILELQFNMAMDIAQKSYEYLVSGTFDSSSSAVSAYFKSTEEIRRSVGISEMVEKMSKMSDAELEKTIQDMLKRASDSGQIIEGEELEEEEDSGDTE